jgi:hypothetical protein
MKTMQEQMNRLQQTTDPKERQKLLQEHMQTMREQVRDVRAVGGWTTMGMMGPGMHGGMHGGKAKDPKARDKAVQDCEDMMQTPAPAPAK